jgi:hypothetical protein
MVYDMGNASIVMYTKTNTHVQAASPTQVRPGDYLLHNLENKLLWLRLKLHLFT